MPDYVIGPIEELHTLAGVPGLRRAGRLRDTCVLRNAAVAVVDGVVAAVGAADDVLSAYDLPSEPASLVTPGFVDAHTHICWAGDRADEFLRRSQGESYQDIAAAGGGILSTMRATREASVDDLADLIVQRADAMFEAGSIHIEVKASYGLSPEACLRELDAIQQAQETAKATLVPTYMGAHAFPPEYPRDDYLRMLCDEMIPAAAAHPAKPEFCDVFCEVGAFTREEAERVLVAAVEHGMRPKIHADEFNDLGGVAMACRLGAASCDHLLVTGEGGKRALAESDTAATLMPGTALYLGKPYADARGLADAGCAVALGTDFNPGSSMVMSMALTMGLAVAKMGLTPEEALTAATVNAAAAIGVETGRIEPGMPIAAVAWDCPSLAQFVWQFTFARPSRIFAASRAG